MSSFFRGNHKAGANGWCVNSTFDRVAKWDNQAAGHSNNRVVVRLMVGRPHRVSADPLDGTILVYEALETLFVLDTGSTTTLLCGLVANQLHLPLSGTTTRVRTVGGQFVPVVSAEVAVRIGDQWLLVPCYVPSPVAPGDTRKNLLGMEGLLDGHLLGVERDEVHVFRKL